MVTPKVCFNNTWPPKRNNVWFEGVVNCIKYFYIFIGVEKKNNDFQRYFHRKINHLDAAKNLLMVEKRQEGSGKV